MKYNNKLNQTGTKKTLFSCTSCSQLSQNILCLRCSHDICLDCASRQLQNCAKQKQISIETITTFKCNICGARTKIEATALAILAEMNREKVQFSLQASEKKGEDISQFNPSAYKLNRSFQLPQAQLSAQKQSQKKENVQSFSQNVYCKYHPNEIEQLYCFTCQQECICVQCYLTGNHKAQNHDVRNIRNSEENLFEVISQIQSEINEKISKCEQYSEKITTKKKQLQKEVQQINKFLQQGINQLKVLLEEKLEFMLQNNESFLQQKNQELTGVNGQIEDNLRKLNRYKSELNECLKSNEIQNLIQSFNYYSQNKNQIGKDVTLIQDELANLVIPKLNIKVNTDFNSIQEHIAKLSWIKLEVLSLGGLESLDQTELEQQIVSKVQAEQTAKNSKTSWINSQQSNSSQRPLQFENTKLAFKSKMQQNQIDKLIQFVQSSPKMKSKTQQNQLYDIQSSFDTRTNQLLEKLKNSFSKERPNQTSIIPQQQNQFKQLSNPFGIEEYSKDKLLYQQPEDKQLLNFVGDLSKELQDFRKKLHQK